VERLEAALAAHGRRVVVVESSPQDSEDNHDQHDADDQRGHAGPATRLDHAARSALPPHPWAYNEFSRNPPTDGE
jgi:hypothetical protein